MTRPPNRQPWDIFYGGPRVPVLSYAQCEAVVEALMTRSQHWTGRQALEDQVHLFHTLGAATYLDPPSRYGARAQQANPVLQAGFSELYDCVVTAIADTTGYPATLSERLGLPGFHIFRGDPRVPPGLMYGGTVHMDKPHERHAFPETIRETLSLTLPLRIPASGAGMYFWPEVPNTILSGPKAPHDMSDGQRAWFDAHKQYVGYTPGDMVLHDGLTVHQLANPGPTRADEWRISLQGHGVLCNGTWELFF